MPLEEGSSRAAIGANIKREEAAGKPPAQAEAIAIHKAKDLGGNLPAEVSQGEILERSFTHGTKW